MRQPPGGPSRPGKSHGISGYDKWGCEISRKHELPVHQDHCFNTTQPGCPVGDTIFHAECVGDTPETIDGRFFDTCEPACQERRRSDCIVLKIDVEGAEWDSFLAVPDHILQQTDQMAMEFTGQRTRRSTGSGRDYLRLVQPLKHFYEVAHIHFNNASCIGDWPFPSFAYEVLFVNKRLAIV